MSTAFRSNMSRKRPSLSEDKVSHPGRGRMERMDPSSTALEDMKANHLPLKMRMARTITPPSKMKGEKKKVLDLEKWRLCSELRVNVTF